MPIVIQPERVKSLKQGAVLIIGDIMLDHYLIGDVERISPEAPVPVVNVAEESLFLGGAGNVAQNITALGGKAFLVGVCGQDEAAKLLVQELAIRGVEDALVVLKNRPTTQKTRILARRQQMLRFDREIKDPVSQPEMEQILEQVAKFLPLAGAVIISDYGKGLVSAELMQKIKALINKDGRNLPLLVDPKPQNIDFYAGVTLLTPNTKETSEAASLPTRSKEEIILAGRAIIQKLGCAHLMTTLGADGMAVFVSEDEIWHIPTAAQEVFDVTGAGDTVIATTALALASGFELVEACVLANISAGIVVGQVGTATASEEQVLQMLVRQSKICPQRWV